MPPLDPEQKRFEETRWSLILKAGGDGHRAHEALEELCTRYWYPVYAFIQRAGKTPADAEDLTQDFFAQGNFRQAKRPRGKFRSYVMRAVKNQLVSSHLHYATLRRGGQVSVISLDQDQAEARLAQAFPDTDSPPELLFDREWAVAVVTSVLEKLRSKYVHLEKAEFFDALQEIIQGRPENHFYPTLAERFVMTENAVRVAAHWLRIRYGNLLEDEVADLIDDPTQEEIRYLFEALTCD